MFPNAKVRNVRSARIFSLRVIHPPAMNHEMELSAQFLRVIRGGITGVKNNTQQNQGISRMDEKEQKTITFKLSDKEAALLDGKHNFPLPNPSVCKPCWPIHVSFKPMRNRSK